MTEQDQRVPVLDEVALSWAHRCIWLACVAVYLTVFVGSMLAGAADLTAMGRAVGLTIATALVGKLAVGLMSRATQPVEKSETGRMADGVGKVGSLVDLVSSPKVTTPETEASAS